MSEKPTPGYVASGRNGHADPDTGGICMVDVDGQITAWSAGATEITGCPRTEMMGADLPLALERFRAPHLAGELRRALEGRRVGQAVSCAPWCSGVDARITIGRDDDGTSLVLVRFSLVPDDIEQDDPTPVLAIEPDGRVRALNLAGCGLCHLTGAHSPADLIPESIRQTVHDSLRRENATTVYTTVGGVDIEWSLYWSPTLGAVRCTAMVRDSREHYRLILRNSVDGIFQTGRDGRLLYANQALAVLFGYATPAAMLAAVTDVSRDLYVNRQDRVRFVRAINARGEARGFETAVRRRDGSDFWIALNARAVRDDNGRVHFYVGTVNDITARKTVEHEARDRHERYRDLIQAAGSAIVALDSDGVIREWNPAASEITGYSWLEAVGQPFATLLEADSERGRLAHHVRRWTESRDTRNAEIRIRRRDGTTRVTQWNSRTQTAADGHVRGVICIGHDITERQATELAVERAERQYRSLFEHASDGIFQADQDGALLHCNPALAEILGYRDRDALIDARIALDRIIPDPEHYGSVMHRLASGEPVHGLEMRVAREDGDPAWLRVSLQSVTNQDGSGIEGTVSDVTEARRSAERLEYLAHHDSLTGLPNRHAFQRHLHEQVLQVARARQRGLALLMFDLDNFKDINDILGHRFGDALLTRVAYELGHWARHDDQAARLGGDEFALVLNGTHDESEAMEAASEVVQRLSRPHRLRGHELSTTVSCGVTLFPGDAEGQSPEQATQTLLQNADMALYWAKAEGRGVQRRYRTEMHALLSARKALEDDLRQALDNGQFQLAFQPVYCLRRNVVAGVESLLRWHHPQRGQVPPAEFIPVAERLGLIRAIGQWVLEQACTTVQAWRDAGLLDTGFVVSVNLSPQELLHSDVAEVLAETLARAGLEPSRLLLEITETTMITSPGRVRELLGQLRAFGVRIAIDDFGTGYSSLNYLKDLPVDVLKIDRSFVEGMTESDRNAAIVEAVVRLGHSLNLTVTAEGIENDEQLKLLRAQSVDQAQGYFLGKPMPAEDLAALLGRPTEAS